MGWHSSCHDRCLLDSHFVYGRLPCWVNRDDSYDPHFLLDRRKEAVMSFELFLARQVARALCQSFQCKELAFVVLILDASS